MESLVATTAAAAVSTALLPIRGVGPVRRHVEQHDQPQACGRRHQQLGGVGRDQAVDQGQAAVGKGGQHLGQTCAVASLRLRPRSGHGVLAHAPPPGPQTVEQPSVVDVAPAGPGEVVDPLGDHRMQGRGRA